MTLTGLPFAIAVHSSTLRCDLTGEPAWFDSQGQRHRLARKDAALLALLSLEGAQTRDHLATLLWPDVPLHGAHANLRQRLHRLRRATGHELVDLGDLVRLAPGLQFDVDDLSPAGASAVSGSIDRLLGAFEFDDCEALSDWLRPMRERWQVRRAEAVAQQAAAMEARGELAGALILAERGVALAPSHEHAWRRLMRLHYLRGDRAAAIAVFERCERHLRDDLSTRPDTETLALLALIERSAVPFGAGEVKRQLPAALLRPPLLLGRALQWQAMERAWQAGRPFVLLAPAGFGKSRLWSDFLLGRAGVVALRARSGDEQTPYAVFSRCIEAALATWPVALAPHDQRELARLLPALGPSPLAPAQQGVLWRAIEAALVTCAGAGLAVLAIDDLQFADAASVDVLRWLASSQALEPVRVALAARPGEGAAGGEALRAWLAESARPEPVEIGPWTQAEVGQLLDSLQLPELAATRWAEPLFRHAGGHPFFTLETLKERWLSRDTTADTGLPQTATAMALIERRLASLSAFALSVLRLAAVLGSDLDAHLVARLAGCSLLALAEPWAELEAADLLRNGDFAHDLVREAALRRVPAVIARPLHAQVARALAEQDTQGTLAQKGRNAARVAVHWQAAQCWPEAGLAFQTTGMAARQAGRLLEQASLLDAAAECYRHARDRRGEFEALYSALDSHLIRLGGQAKLALLPRLQDLVSDDEQRIRLGMAHADALLNMAQFDDALRVTETLAADARNCGQHLADALCLRGQCLSCVNRWEEAIAVLMEARSAAHDDVQRLHVLAALAWSYNAGQRPADAIAAQQGALAAAVALEDTAEIALTHGNLATLLSVAGDPHGTAHHAQAARQIHQDMGSTRGAHAGMNLIALGSAWAWFGRFDVALPVLREAMQVLDRHAGAAAWTKARLSCAQALIWQGEQLQAADLLDDEMPGVPAALRLQRHVLRARLAGMSDTKEARARRLAELELVNEVLVTHPELRTQPTAMLEWATVAEPRAVATALAALLPQALPLPGLARSLQVREMAARTVFDVTGAAALAQQLVDSVTRGDGLHVSLPRAQAQGLLAQAFDAAGQGAAAERVRALVTPQ